MIDTINELVSKLRLFDNKVLVKAYKHTDQLKNGIWRLPKYRNRKPCVGQILKMGNFIISEIDEGDWIMFNKNIIDNPKLCKVIDGYSKDYFYYIIDEWQIMAVIDGHA